MSDFPVGLREVVPNQTVPEKCREFSINTGKIWNPFNRWQVKIEKDFVNILDLILPSYMLPPIFVCYKKCHANYNFTHFKLLRNAYFT